MTRHRLGGLLATIDYWRATATYLAIVAVAVAVAQACQ